MLQKVFFYREIVNFSHLKCKQYSWFELLFFHAGCIWKYFVLWNVSWWSQIICLINFYQFYGHVVIYMANLLWIFWKTNSSYSLYSINFLWYHRPHLFLSFSWSLDLFGWRIIEKKHIEMMYVQDAFTGQKGHIKCTVAQKEEHWPLFLVLIVVKLYV